MHSNYRGAGMLILNRRQGEAILIDGGIRIVVLSSDRRGARIGIEAPSHVNIQREELLSRVAKATPDEPK
ncbi:MAG TPA: carbon storage regulator [Gemmatimonadales bacterium]|jgi:carbon storage regulator|nr:carbon storage regulator [Gemmatimonadales bacterium]